MEQIKEFFINNLKSLGFGILYLILGLLVLPDSWVLFILSKIKPKLIIKIKEPVQKLLNTFVNLYINNKFINIEEKDDSFNKKTEYYLEQNDKIDKNCYVIDLCKDIVKTLDFVFSPENNFTDVYEQTFNYLYYYSKLLVYIDQDKNFCENFSEQLTKLNESYSELMKTDYDGNTDKKQIYILCHKQQVESIFDYLKNEREKLDNLKKENKAKLVQLLKDKVNDN